MTFPEILEAIDTLSKDQLAQLKQKIQHREAEQIHSPDLSAFEALSDEALWTIVNEPFHLKNRLDELHDLRDTRLLTDDEEDEVDELLELSDTHLLKRSMAMVTLQKRGVDVLGELSRG